MAKNKKSPAKAAKKAAKAKPVAKAKKAAPAKGKKTVAKKPAVAKAAPKVAAKVLVTSKKAAEKKEVLKKEKVTAKPIAKTPAEKPSVKPAVVSKKVEKEIVATQTVQAPVSKPAPPQLNIFPVPNQRPIAHKPAKPSTTGEERTRYSEDELKEFEALILKKLDKAKEEYKILKETLNRNNDEGTDATSGGNTKVLEDGAETAEKENLSQLAARQQKYIMNLENALIRIKNGTYGICSVTGKLIPRERLIAVPHTTQSIEAKMMQQD